MNYVMIIFEFIFFLILSFLTILTFYGLGQLVLNKIKKNFFESIFFGFIVSAFIVTLLHFFLKINLYVIIFVFILGFSSSIKNLKFFFNFNFRENFIYILIFFVFIPIFLSQKYHEDFGYYHLPYVINLFNEKIIFGMANVNPAFIHNSIWLNLLALFHVNNNFNFLLLPSFLLFVFFNIYCLRNIFNNKNHKVSDYFLIVSLFYLILKFTRISEFGTDVPVTIFSLLSIFYYFKYFETTESALKISYFYFILGFTTFSILIKFSSIPLIILVIFIYFKDFKILKKEILKSHYIFIYVFIFLFFIQQFIYSGCFIFPTEFSCFNMSWYNEDFLEWMYNLELINKSFASANNEISKENYLLEFNWVSYWFKRSYPELLEHLLTMFIPLMIFLIILKNNNKKIKNNYNFLIFILFVLIGFIFWFTFSPVFRFSVPYFLSLIFIITLNIFMKKQFSKKVFITFILLIIVFNLSKNIVRVSKKDTVYFGMDNIKNEFISLSDFTLETPGVHKPDIKNNKNGWQGRLCWDIPFLCSYNDVSLQKKYGYLFVNKLNKLK